MEKYFFLAKKSGDFFSLHYLINFRSKKILFFSYKILNGAFLF